MSPVQRTADLPQCQQAADVPLLRLLPARDPAVPLLRRSFEDHGHRHPAGADGAAGKDGSDGQPGNDGTTFTPSVDDDGNLSWSNNGGLPNPETVNIKGPAGDPAQGGSSATSHTVTLLSTGWTDNGDGRYVQSVAVPGVTESTPIVMVDVALYSNNADENALIVEAVYQTDGSIMQQPVVQGVGTLTFYTVTVPSVDIPLYVGVIG